MTIKRFLILLLLLIPIALQAQPDKVYKSLDEVSNPEDVYVLKLRWKRLKTIPPEVFSFVNLRQLDLSNNRIDTIPSDIANLAHLETLDLSRNALSYLPIEVGLLGELQDLDLSRNPLVELPESMAYLPKLQKLTLWSTNIYRLPESFAALDVVLRVIDLRSCQLTLTDQEAITALLPSVKRLWDQACNCQR